MIEFKSSFRISSRYRSRPFGCVVYEFMCFVYEFMCLKSYWSVVCKNGSLRLSDGQTNGEGRVEICFNGIWGTICQDGWDSLDATVVCRQLGFKPEGNITLCSYVPVSYLTQYRCTCNSGLSASRVWPCLLRWCNVFGIRRKDNSLCTPW